MEKPSARTYPTPATTPGSNGCQPSYLLLEARVYHHTTAAETLRAAWLKARRCRRSALTVDISIAYVHCLGMAAVAEEVLRKARVGPEC